MTAAVQAIDDGVLVRLRVTPNANADRIDGEERRDDGSSVLRVHVRAVPDKGKANAAVIALLAKALGIPRSSITLVSGETRRLKTLRIAGDPARLLPELSALAGA